MNQLTPLQNELAIFELEADEQILWAGKPDPLRLTTGALPFSALGTGLAAIGVFIQIFARTLHSASGTTALTLCGLVFLLCGIVMMFVPFFFWHSAKKTIYAITNCRVLISSGGNVTAKTIQDIAPVVREQHSDGKTDLLFLKKDLGSGRVMRDGFFALANYEPAERLLLEMAEKRHNDLRKELDMERP